jgi:hypothetical protein
MPWTAAHEPGDSGASTGWHRAMAACEPSKVTIVGMLIVSTTFLSAIAYTELSTVP